MKHLKMIGLAALAAAALMAIAGAGTASATVFCHSESTPCSQKWGVGTEPRFTVTAGTAGIWTTTAGEVVAKCPEGEIRGKISSAGSGTETVKIPVEPSGFTWPSVESCIKTETVEGGTLEFHSITGTTNGQVTVTGFKISISILGSSCIYGFGTGENLGTLTSSGTGKAVLHINTSFLKKEGGLVCPESLKWSEQFTQVAPSGTALFVEPS